MFDIQFGKRLEVTVESKLNEMALNSTVLSTSNLDTSNKDDAPLAKTTADELKKLEAANKRLEQKVNELENKIKSLTKAKSKEEKVENNHPIEQRLGDLQLATAAAQVDIVQLKRFEKELNTLKAEVLHSA